MSPRPDVSEERRKQIMQAAMVVFARLGFQQARMEDIAREAGLSKGTLYLYFDSKEAVIMAVQYWFYEVDAAELAPLVEGTMPAEESLTWFTHFLAERIAQMKEMATLAFEFYALVARNEEVRTSLKQYYATYQRILAACIRRGIERGELCEVDADDVATAIISIYEGTFVLFALDPSAVQWEAQCLATLRLLLASIKTAC
ncbi:MAG: TetR/AcrR family transcriptional regulator [Ktedonobacteraceae bacterium]|nr:TetR/AcrR family transcriptional regulator [Ktedonobacteraceae bacterium]